MKEYQKGQLWIDSENGLPVLILDGAVGKRNRVSFCTPSFDTDLDAYHTGTYCSLFIRGSNQDHALMQQMSQTEFFEKLLAGEIRVTKEFLEKLKEHGLW